MRRTILTFVVAVFVFHSAIFGQYITAEDNAGNYSTWTNGSNLGFGFEAWNIWTSGTAGVFIGSSAGQGFGDIDTQSKSFGMWGNPSGDNYSNAQRIVNNWGDGATFTVKIATAWRNGNKGIDVFATGFENVWNFNVGSDQYTAGGVNQTSWAYSQTSVFTLTITQNGSNMQISLTRGSDSYSTTINSKTFYAFKFYCGSTSSGDLNNLFFNSMKAEYSDPSKVPSAANVKINGNVNLASDKSLTVKNLTVTSGNSFTLKSLATGTASLITTGTITGNVTVERYLTGGWDWHLLSSPVVDQPITGPSNFIGFTFGTGGNEGDPNIDFYRYNEAATSSPWVNIKSENGTLNTSFGTPSSNPLFEEGLGYLVAYQTATITKNFAGIPFTGPKYITLSYSSGGSKGWNLVGNPYPSAIDWDEGTITKSGLFNEYYYIYNQDMNGGGGGYEYYSSGFAPYSAGANGDIPAMQAFFVKAGSSGGSLTLSNNCRKHSTQPFLKEELENENLLELKLQGETYFSKSQIFLSENADPGTDSQDAFMLFSMNDEVPQVFSVSGDDRLVLNAVPLPNQELILPLGIRVGNTGAFTLIAENMDVFNSAFAVILEDIQENQMTDLRQNLSYTFTTATGGINNNRFALHLKTGVGINEADNSVQPLFVVDNRILKVFNLMEGSYRITITDVAGRFLFTGNYQPGQSMLLPASLTTGVYLIQLTGNQKTYTQKVVIQ